MTAPMVDDGWRTLYERAQAARERLAFRVGSLEVLCRQHGIDIPEEDSSPERRAETPATVVPIHPGERGRALLPADEAAKTEE